MKTIISFSIFLGMVIVIGLFFANSDFQTATVHEPVIGVVNELPTESSNVVANSPVDQTPKDQIDEVQPAIAAGAYLISSGEQLDGWKTNKRWPIASITKLLSAYSANYLMDPNELILIDQEAIDTEGESGNLQLGDLVKVSDLIKAMLIASSNDAAVAVANHYGSQEFVAQMHLLAVRAGMVDSQFVEPTGLSVQNQSTVEELVKLISYMWENDRDFLSATRQSTGIVIDTKTFAARQLVSTNDFVTRSDFLGGKTGTLPESDGNLISIFSHSKFSEPVVIVVLGSKDRFKETLDILESL